MKKVYSLVGRKVKDPQQNLSIRIISSSFLKHVCFEFQIHHRLRSIKNGLFIQSYNLMLCFVVYSFVFGSFCLNIFEDFKFVFKNSACIFQILGSLYGKIRKINEKVPIFKYLLLIFLIWHTDLSLA